jgi:pimeloyl-ACP methyl ester carboxylesterase
MTRLRCGFAAAIWAVAVLAAPSLGAAAPAAAKTPAAAPGFLTLQQLRAKYAQPNSRYMTIKGVEVHYIDEGSGPAILMLHGSYSSLKTYDRVAAALKDRYRVIRYDMPPSGLSGSVPTESLAMLAPEDLPAILLTNLGVKSATVVGVSSGGATAYVFAARNPDMVERLILSNTPADPPINSRMVTSKALMAEVAADKGPFKRRSYWDAFFTFFAGEPERITPAMRDEYFDMNRRLNANHNEMWVRTTNTPLIKADAAKVTCPVLLLWGGRDAFLDRPTMDTLAAYLKNADLSEIVMPDVGHYPPLEAPERFAQITAAYISQATPVKPRAPPPSDR